MAEYQPSLPGITTTVSFDVQVFDFESAMDFIKGKLSDDFLEEKWSDSLIDALKLVKIEGYLVSACWMSIRYLNLLWELLFGRTTGPAPWLDLLKGLHRTQLNGTADQTVNINYNYVEATHVNPLMAAEARMGMEARIREQLGRHFPMRILMPRIITPTPQEDSSKPLASNDVDESEVKQS